MAPSKMESSIPLKLEQGIGFMQKGAAPNKQKSPHRERTLGGGKI